jgi:hypothetical protein
MSYLKDVNIKQNVIVSDGNSSSTNLSAYGTYTGTSASTLGVNGIQVSLHTDRNCYVYIDQSPDGYNWDLTNLYQYRSSEVGLGITEQAVNSYARVRVVNNEVSATSFFRLQTVMCPIVEALPQALTESGRLKTESVIVGRDGDEIVEVTETNMLGVATYVKLVGSNFDGAIKDINFWTESIVNGASASQSGDIQLRTNTSANASIKYTSNIRGRFIIGTTNYFVGYARVTTSATTNNYRRIGAYDDADGFFFELDGSTFNLVTRRGGSDIKVPNGTFNGNLGLSYIVDNSYHKLEIEWTPLTVYFYIDGYKLHSVSNGILTNFLTLPIRIENTNYSGQTANVIFDCLAAAILRTGQETSLPTYKRITTGSTTVCKYGSGTLQRVIMNQPANGTVTIYDNTTSAGTIIAIVDPDNGVTPFGLEYNLPFSTGLTIVNAVTVDMTVIYE